MGFEELTAFAVTKSWGLRRNVAADELTDRKHQERQASVGRHVGYLLHQVRSPIVTIGLLARSLLRRAKLRDADREKVDQIIAHVAKVERMLNASLDYLRPPRAGAERVSVVNLVGWVRSQIEPQAKEAQVAVEVSLAEDLPVLLGHRQLLREAFLNVALNAVEAAAETTGTVTLRARVTAKSVVLEVVDTGKGMSDETIAEAFEPFVTHKENGTGLGLPLARKIVGCHGGRIAIHSQERGTQVALYLPKETR